MGYLLLEGGDEFGGQMAAPDRRALELAGGLGAAVRIIPAAAAPDGNHQRVGRTAERWFRGLGALDVSWLPLIDRASADEAKVVAGLRASQLVFLAGGFPGHLARSLSGSDGWRAIVENLSRQTVLAGSSAGAMILCDTFYDPQTDRIARGLGLLGKLCILPHHDTFGQRWAHRLAAALPGVTLLGIEEQTGVLNDGPQGTWRVYGKGSAVLYRKGTRTHFDPTEAFSLDA
jgi:cyanophycinase